MNTRSPIYLFLLPLVFVLAVAGPVRAQDLSSHPGYFPLDELELVPRDQLTVEINLQGALLNMVANAIGPDDPEFSSLVENLKAIRVRVANAEDVDVDALRSRFESASRDLEALGWLVIVRVREYGEELYIYSREEDGEILGMTVLALEEGGEAAIINIIGMIRFDQLMGLGDSFDIPALRDMPGSSDADEEDE